MSSPLHIGADVVNLLQRMVIYSRAAAAKMPSPAPSTHKPAELPRDLVALPVPQPLTPRLVALGLDRSSANNISLAFTRASLRIKDAINDNLRHRRPILKEELRDVIDTKFCSSITLAYSGIYAQSIQRWSSYILDTLVPRVLHARTLEDQRKASLSPQRRRAFNQSAIPILEEFFEKNAFPTRLEKYELAHRCDMEYRQIHVWFQNRRSRSRKDGKALKKPSHAAIPTELEDSVVNAILPEVQQDDDAFEGSDDNALHDNPLITQHEGFTTVAPPHAFPSVYPPLCSYNPFPLASGQKAFTSPWPRAMRHEVPRPQAVGISELISGMAKLSIVDDANTATSIPASRTQSRPRDLSLLLSYGIVTICPRAPHPARIGRRCTPSSAQKLSCEADIAHLRPSAACTTSRKRRGLPRRVPKHCPRSDLRNLQQSGVSRTTSAPYIPRSVSVVSSSSSGNSESGTDTPLSTPPTHPTSLSFEDAPSLPSLAKDTETLVVGPASSKDPWSWLDSYSWDGDSLALHQGDCEETHSSFIYPSL